MSSQEDTWKSLPIDLQERFYYEAEEEAGHLLEVIEEVEKAVNDGKSRIEKSFEPIKTSDDVMTVAAIDGSRSVRPGDKLGARFTVYSAGMVVVRGLERMEDPLYSAGRVRTSQTASQDFSQFLLSMLQNLEERKMALEALKRDDIDLVIIDGSFFGFSYEIFKIRREGLMTPSLERLFKETYDASQELIKSHRCIGVIKRSRARAIGGFLSYEDKRRNPLSGFSDKLILSHTMPRNTIMNYQTLLGAPQFFQFRIYGRLATQITGGTENIDYETELSNAKTWVSEGLRKAFQIPTEEAEQILSSLSRMYVRIFEEASPFELEGPSDGARKLKEFLGNQDNFNEATGLPIALDMVDELVSIPREFTRDFAQEVEARIAQKYDGKLEAIKTFFTNLNPQKDI